MIEPNFSRKMCMRFLEVFAGAFLCIGCGKQPEVEQSAITPPVKTRSVAIVSAINRALGAIEPEIDAEHKSLSLQARKSKNGWLIILKLDPESDELHSETLISVPDGLEDPYIGSGM